MSTLIRRSFNWTSLLAIFCLAGCKQENVKYGAQSRGANWMSVATDAIPGIDEGTVTSVVLYAGPTDGVPFVVWSDLQNGWSDGGGGRVGEATGEGQHRGENGRQLDYHARTTDGKAGTITIADVEYDFANGSLFLVSARGELPKVAQIKYDISEFPNMEATALMKLARSSAPIRDFFEKERKEDTIAK